MAETFFTVTADPLLKQRSARASEEQLSPTDRERKRRWHEVITLKKAAVMRGEKIRVANALEGDAPEQVRARHWQRLSNSAGAESFYLSNLAAMTSLEARAELDAGNETRARELALEAQQYRQQAEAAQQRYEVAGFYDAHALREIIRLELREKIATAGGKPLLFEARRAALVEAELRRSEKRSREAEHASSSFDLKEKLSSAPANAPGQSSLKKTRKEPLAIIH